MTNMKIEQKKENESQVRQCTQNYDKKGKAIIIKNPGKV
jgi:hypothetical protein